MIRRLTLVALVGALALAVAQTAAADPVNAKEAGLFTAVCGSTQVDVVVNGNGDFTPAHVLGSSAVFVPTAIDLTFVFTPTGGSSESEHFVATKPNTPKNGKIVTCSLPAALNTVTFPDGTFVASGTVTGFFA
jgi:hypothetical protein